MRHQLHTEVVIDAPPEAVWDILTDLHRYPDWNPFVVSSEGSVEVGAKLVNRHCPGCSSSQDTRSGLNNRSS